VRDGKKSAIHDRETSGSGAKPQMGRQVIGVSPQLQMNLQTFQEAKCISLKK